MSASSNQKSNPTDNGPEDDFEAFDRRRPGFNLTETEDPGSLGDRDLDRLYDWPTSFDKYDFDDNWWTRSKAEFPCEQVVAVDSSPDTLNPLRILGQQLELLVNSGQPDITRLFTSLREEALVSEVEYEELKVAFSLEAVRLLIW